MENKDFTLYPESFELKQLGFDEPCFTFYQVEYHENSPIMVDDNDQYRITGFRTCKNSEIPSHYISCPTYSQAFRWFREKYDLHVQIRKENYFQKRKYEYYHFDISKGEENDITNQEDLLDEIFNECSQDIPGNHLNDEMYSKLIFEKEFAFKTYEEAELACIKELIKIVKNKQ
jgi:hypothetical protein